MLLTYIGAFFWQKYAFFLSLRIIAQFFPQEEAGRLHPRHLCRAGPQPRHSGWRRGGGHQGGQQQGSSRLHPLVPRRRNAGCEGWQVSCYTITPPSCSSS